MENTWLGPFTKEVGVPATMAIIFIWYFVRVFLPEQKDMMLNSIKEQKNTTIQIIELLTKKYEQSVINSQEFFEKTVREKMIHNLEIHNNLNKRIDGVVTEIIDFKEEVSKKLNTLMTKNNSNYIQS